MTSVHDKLDTLIAETRELRKAVEARLVSLERKVDRIMPAIDDLTGDLTDFFTKFETFLANVSTALGASGASTSTDPKIVALDTTVKAEAAKLSAAAAALAGTASVDVPAAVAAAAAAAPADPAAST